MKDTLSILLIGMITMLVLHGCNSSNNVSENNFNGDIIIVDMPRKTDYLKGEQIITDAVHTWPFTVYDSIFVCVTNQFPNQLLSVINLHTKKQAGFFCDKGKGPNEMINASIEDDLFVENGQLKQWLYSVNDQKMFLLNVTQSINSQTTRYDSIFMLDWKEKHIEPFNFVFPLDDQKVLAKCPVNPEYYQMQAHTVSNYYLFNPFTNDTLRSYIIHHRPIINELNDLFAPIYLHSVDRIKPDKRKVAMVMTFISQINILDLETGKLQGFRLKNTPDYSCLKKAPSNFTVFYVNLCVDNDYIYGLYSNTSMMNYGKQKSYSESTNEVHVFDWDGNFVKRVILDQKFDDIKLDAKNKIMYAYSINEEELYAYDISKLNEKPNR